MPIAHELPARLALGAAGLAGTMALQALRAANPKVSPATLPPICQDPGQFMVERAEGALPGRARRAIPEWAEPAAPQGLAVGYGLTFGALYAAIHPRGGSVLAEGVALGLATWAAGYLGWLPATGLMPPVNEHDPAQAVLPLSSTRTTGSPPWPRMTGSGGTPRARPNARDRHGEETANSGFRGRGERFRAQLR